MLGIGRAWPELFDALEALLIEDAERDEQARLNAVKDAQMARLRGLQRR